MAITNLLDKKFEPYGRLVHTTENVEFLSSYNYEETSLKGESDTFKFERPVFIERLSGVAIINVAKEEDKSFNPFLLELPVMIEPGVRFSIMPLTEDFSYCIYYKGERKVLAHQDNFNRSKIKDKQIRCKNLIYSTYRHLYKGIVTRGETLPYWELFYFMSGSYELNFNGKIYNIESPAYVFVPPNVKRSIKTGNDELIFCKVLFDMDTDKEDRLFLVRKMTSETAVFFNKIIERSNNETQYNDDFILSLLELIIAETFSSDLMETDEDGKFSVTSIMQMNEIAIRAEQLIYENIFNSELSVGFIAKHLFISTSYLYRCSMLKFGVGISEYIHNKKLEMACELIRGNKYSLSEIASILNFCSQSYFSTRFKKKYGISPLQYSFKINSSSDFNIHKVNES